jgi:hypothetical protein
VDWRTVRKYLAKDADGWPPTAPLRVGTKIDAFTHMVDAWLADDVGLHASVSTIGWSPTMDSRRTTNGSSCMWLSRGSGSRCSWASWHLRPVHRRFEVTRTHTGVDWGQVRSVCRRAGCASKS